MLPYQLLRTAAESEVKGEPWRVRQHRRPLMSGDGCATGAGELPACANGVISIARSRRSPASSAAARRFFGGYFV